MKLLARTAIYGLLVILAFSYFLPFFWMVTSAVKDDAQVYQVPPVWLPTPAYFRNFVDAWRADTFNLYLFNTVFRYAIPLTLGITLSSAFVAYGFARVRWYGRNLLFALCIATMMIPDQVTLVPLFVIFKQLGWLNSYLPLVVPGYFGSAYYIFMLRQFYASVPEELSDAARIDGCSEVGIFWRIMLPLVKPALAVVALFAFMGAWNEYLGPLVYLNRQELFPLALGIGHLRANVGQIGNVKFAYPYLMAASTLVTLPIILAFFFTQRTFIQGITMTGIK
ncbi:MAG: carbohydrate ABC transporter permease [Caldilineaceae bacterium]|nr:carbohydrate ABC transporter permease [Caldilineaceae bacterium]